MQPVRRLAALTLLLVLAACAGGSPPGASPSGAGGGAALVREAEAFMAAYARDLSAGAREAVIARYDDRGAYLVGGGEKTLMPTDSIRATYLGRWQPPASFEWRDLSYEAVGPDAVVVVGRFVWGLSAERRMTYSYTGLLVRRNGALRIRLEDEDPAPSPRP
jgi:hypothetical protein